jgi:Xaa-Pro aminopeptidase
MAVFSSADFPTAKNSKTPACDRIIGLLRDKIGKNIRSITVPPYFPVGLARQLAGKGITVSVADSAVFPEREIKTAKEIQSIIHAQKAAVRAMDAAVTLIAGARIARDRSLKTGNQPLTSEAVRNRIDNVVRDFDCVCYGTIVACGQQAVNPHETGWGTLKADEPIVIDIFPQHIASGYWGDLTRTVIRGTPSDKIQKMYSAVREAQRAAISIVKAGVTAGEIHNTAVELFKKRDFLTGPRRGHNEGFIHSIGHGIGLEIHENPHVGPVETKLKAGNVITVEPGLYYPGQAGIRIEDTLLVTRNAGRFLAQYHYQFIV